MEEEIKAVDMENKTLSVVEIEIETNAEVQVTTKVDPLINEATERLVLMNGNKLQL